VERSGVTIDIPLSLVIGPKDFFLWKAAKACTGAPAGEVMHFFYMDRQAVEFPAKKQAGLSIPGEWREGWKFIPQFLHPKMVSVVQYTSLRTE
jgi:hypothetical protein